MGELWRAWLKERAADKLRNDVYEAQWASLGPFFGHRHPELLVTQDFRDYATMRFAAGRAPATVNTELTRLSAMFKWAFEHRRIAFRPKVWIPSAGKGRERVLTVPEARELVIGARKGDPHIYLFVVIAFATGARHMAILDLTWDRIDFERGLIEFDEDLPPDPMSKAWRKGRATVPMNATVRAALEAARAARQTNSVIEHGGKRLKSVRDGFARAVERAGLGTYRTDPETGVRAFETDVTPHTIRHTVATWLEDRVNDSRRAQLLGHGNVDTTKRVYTHSAPTLLGEAVTLLDAEFAPLPKIAHREIEATPREGVETGSDVPTGQSDLRSDLS